MAVRPRLLRWTVLAFCVLDSVAASQKPMAEDDGPFTPEFAQFALQTLDDWKVPGLAIAVIDNDKVWSQGYGFATYPSKPVTPSTLFYAGSTTKAFLAAAVSLMIDSGNYSSLDWTTPISDLIRDDFVLQDDWATSHITIEDALSHRTGLPSHDTSVARHYDGHRATPRDVVRSLRHLPLNAEPRTTFQYCNLMFVVVSHIVETLTSRWLGDVLKERIWDKLGMKHTYFSLGDAVQSEHDLAQGYYYDEGENLFKEVDHMDLEEVSGAGSVITNVLDYARWAACLLNEAAPLSAKGHSDIKKPRMILDTSKFGPYDTATMYSLGWFTSSYKGHRVYTHSGGMNAFGAEIYLFPDQKYGIVTLGNTAMSSNAAAEVILWSLVDSKLGVSIKDRYDWAGKWRSSYKHITSTVDNALDILYPDRAEPPLPPSLPVAKYAGVYYNAGYQNMTLRVSSDATEQKTGPILVASRRDFTWPMRIEMHHVSSEYWVAHIQWHDVKASFTRQIAATQFKIGPDGSVASFGIEALPVSGGLTEGLIWFTKIT